VEGTPVSNFRLAVNRRSKNNDTNDKVCYIDVVFWGKQAELVQQYLVKGRPVLVDGYLEYRTWEDGQGLKRSQHRVVGLDVQFLGAPAQSLEAPLVHDEGIAF
jgi:single-strand DNA-binding protein